MNTRQMLLKLSKRFPKRIAKMNHDRVGLMMGKLPEEVQVISYDGEFFKTSCKSMTTLKQPLDLMAKKCVELVIKLIKKLNTEKKSLSLMNDLVQTTQLMEFSSRAVFSLTS